MSPIVHNNKTYRCQRATKTHLPTNRRETGLDRTRNAGGQQCIQDADGRPVFDGEIAEIRRPIKASAAVTLWSTHQNQCLTER